MANAGAATVWEYAGATLCGATPAEYTGDRRNSLASGGRLLADTHLQNHSLVALGVVLLQIVQQAATPANHHQKTATRSVVLLVRTEVLGQLADALAEKGNLNFRAAGVGGVGLVLLDDVVFSALVLTLGTDALLLLLYRCCNHFKISCLANNCKDWYKLQGHYRLQARYLVPRPCSSAMYFRRYAATAESDMSYAPYFLYFATSLRNSAWTRVSSLNSGWKVAASSLPWRMSTG